MAKSYFEEFDRKYNRPKMEKITVGFSGIDPAPKSTEWEGGGQIDIIDSGEITLDGGEIH